MKLVTTPDNNFNTCDGTVNGTPVFFTLDTEFMISIIPQEYVSDRDVQMMRGRKLGEEMDKEEAEVEADSKKRYKDVWKRSWMW